MATQSAAVGASRAPLGMELAHQSIVVAVTGEAENAGPVRIAAALERRFAADVAAIEVIDISDVPMLSPVPPSLTFSHRPQAWPVHIAFGAAAYEIVGYANARNARLIVTGLRRHGDGSHERRDETALTVARGAGCAVLAITPEACTLPQRAIVGVDFGPTSLVAARAALHILRHSGSEASALRLVYVQPPDGAHGNAGQALIVRLGVRAALDRLVADLEVPPGVAVERVVRHGDPARELLACATESGADLIALGRQHGGFHRGWELGPVPTDVMRDGRCSVLVVPTTAA
jgi:nucleotide-binding universal stress UspA family protein